MVYAQQEIPGGGIRDHGGPNGLVPVAVEPHFRGNHQFIRAAGIVAQNLDAPHPFLCLAGPGLDLDLKVNPSSAVLDE